MSSHKPPSVSVIMATQARNATYFREAVESILSQTLSDFELLIVFDGCGEDATEQMLANFDDPRIRAIRSARNRGLARSLNIAVRLARAPLLARMDDDDRCLPDRLQLQHEEIERRRCDVLGAKAFIIDGEGRRVEGAVLTGNPDLAKRPFGAIFGNLFIHPAVMMRRTWALQHRYDRSWGRGQDRELWVRAAPTSIYGYVEAPLLEYRRQQTTKSVQMKNVQSAYSLIWKFRRRFYLYVPALFLANGVRHLIYGLKRFFTR